MDLKFLEGKKVFITGATGLIGGALIKRILEWNKSTGKRINVAALIRNKEKAKKTFADDFADIEFIVSDIKQLKPQNIGADYVIH